MVHVGVAVLQGAAAVADRGIHRLRGDHRADRLVAGAEALGDGVDVGRHAVVLAGEQGAGTAHPAHNLVADQQHAVAVADLAHPGEIGRASSRERACQYVYLSEVDVSLTKTTYTNTLLQ